MSYYKRNRDFLIGIRTRHNWPDVKLCGFCSLSKSYDGFDLSWFGSVGIAHNLVLSSVMYLFTS
jgi:hypothetical protein